MISDKSALTLNRIHIWPKQMKHCRRHRVFLAGLALLLFPLLPCRANVYATDLKLNGSLTNSWVAPGFPALVSYILNEPATGGVQVHICAGTNILKTFLATNGQPGALTGSNAFLWDGTDSHGSNVAQGLYTLQITAGAVGYADWTNITDDGTNFEVDYPISVDVNKNTNSPYYGRVFVGNAPPTYPEAPPPPGDGIYKFNADGSPADEGGFSDGGYGWGGPIGGLYSPWKIVVGANDRVYINDWDTSGTVLDFDNLIDPNFVIALASDAYPTDTVDLGGLYLTGSPTNQQIWMTDAGTYAPSLGVLRWNLQADGTVLVGDSNAAVVVAATNSALSVSPWDLAVATNGCIYVIQLVGQPGDPANRVLCFPPWTNGAPPETAAKWAIGRGDMWLANAYGVDVNPEGTFVAVAVRGSGSLVPEDNAANGGNLSIFSAASGQLVKRFAIEEDDSSTNQFTDVAWDNVGNLYALDLNAQVWRAYSPPGTNQATTVCVAGIEFLNTLQPPQLSQATMTTNGATFMLDGQSDVTYVVQLSTNLMDWTDVDTNFDTVPDRFISLPPTTDPQDFYRAVVWQNN